VPSELGASRAYQANPSIIHRRKLAGDPYQRLIEPLPPARSTGDGAMRDTVQVAGGPAEAGRKRAVQED
jgi:hypothetical protein